MSDGTEDFYLSILDSMSQQVAVIDDQGFIQWVNQSWARFSQQNDGTPEQTDRNANYIQVCQNAVDGGDDESIAPLVGVQGVLEGRDPNFYFEYPCHSPDEQRWFLMRIRPLDMDGPQRFVVSHENITERKLIELHVERLVEKRTHELAQQTARLEQALQSEKELSNLQRQFVAMVSHEFRTPLTIIDGSSQRLKRHKADITPDELDARSDKIRRSVQRMTTMIETVLYVERLDEHQIEFMPVGFDLKATLTAACAEKSKLSPQQNITVDVGGLPTSVEGDQKLLQQVVAHLLDNAVKYAKSESPIEIKGWTEGGDVLVSVRDRGVGIGADEQSKVFERFYRGASSMGVPGTGLGLSICKQFAKMHGGDIAVKSTEGEGAAFTVRLPIQP